MKNTKILIVAVIILCVTMNSTATAFAATTSTKEPYVSYSIETEDDEALENATVISTNSYIEDGRAITETVYEQPDGTIITDTLNVSAIASFSKNGTDTATRTRTIKQWGTITITASFKWYTEGLFSYVKCTGMSASHSLSAQARVKTWETSYTKNYVSIGKAKAQVEYYFYNSIFNAQYQNGTFKITCTDSGTIKDNGN